MSAQARRMDPTWKEQLLPKPRGLTGQEVLLSEEHIALAKKARAVLLSRARKARSGVVPFFEFVMREETTRRRIKVAPHQRVGLDFMLAHDRSANMWPVGHAKSFCMGGLSLFLTGQDCTTRGAIVSAKQEQAAKIVKMVRDYIETSDELHLVYPDLVPSTRRGDPWTQTAITVKRPPGIRDPTLVAVGIDGGLPGARLNWVVVDDILDRENTATKEQRDKVYEWFDSTVLSRLDPYGARIIVTNTAWHPDDLLHRLKKLGWATMRMDILGDLEIQDDEERLAFGLQPWDHEELRPRSAKSDDYICRLKSHEPDPGNNQSLWPERVPPHSDNPKQQTVAKLRRSHLPHRFNQLYRNICRDDATAKCQEAWIEECKRKARERGIFSLSQKPRGDGQLVFTGVDLAVSPGEENDDTAFFTFEVTPDGHRVLLDIEIGQYNGPTIIDLLFKKQVQYNGVLRVENNAAQDYIRQFALQRNVSLPIKPHTTGRAKAHPEHGVEGLFIEIYNGAWLIPNDRHGHCDSRVQAWIDACLYYEPSKHTSDVLMACYFAREQAKEWGVLSGSDTAAMVEAGSIGMEVMAR